MIFKKSSPIYNPQDELERAIQDAFHKYNQRYLTAFECRLAAKTIASLKIKNDWVYEDKLLPTRMDAIFGPKMSSDDQQVVFATSLLFFRDIMENQRISGVLNDPVVLVSKPIAYYFLREYPLHLIIDIGKIKQADFIRIGGLNITETNVSVSRACLAGVKINNEMNKKYIATEVRQIVRDADKLCNSPMSKAAVKLKGEGVFRLEYGIEPEIKADDFIQHKISKKTGKVNFVEPGDTGWIGVQYDDGDMDIFKKSEFNINFVQIPETGKRAVSHEEWSKRAKIFKPEPSWYDESNPFEYKG